MLATVQGVSHSVNGSVVTLMPMASATDGVRHPGNSMALFGWRCGSTTDGTNVPAKYLPGSCRG